ncbi:MAG: cupin domain-containing protein, partial [Desulfonatronovibrio sp.]
MSREKIYYGNIYENLPRADYQEHFEDIHKSKVVRIERIISLGQATPEGEWYDQDWDEWVVLLKGQAGILIYGQEKVKELSPGDYIFLSSGLKHRVEWTSVNEPCVWLAIHFNNPDRMKPVFRR